jgi:hypothetical protein
MALFNCPIWNFMMEKRIRILNDKNFLLLLKILGTLIITCVILSVFLHALGTKNINNYYKLAESVWGKRPDNLTFKSQNCGTAGPYFNPNVEQLEWERDNSLYIHVAVPVNCADYNWIGNFQIVDENTLILMYITVPSFSEAACICKADFEYKIDGISIKEYSIVIQEMDIE